MHTATNKASIKTLENLDFGDSIWSLLTVNAKCEGVYSIIFISLGKSLLKFGAGFTFVDETLARVKPVLCTRT